jgi:hypothetical protein
LIFKTLSEETQEGIRQFYKDTYGDEDEVGKVCTRPDHWSWLWFLLRQAEDKPEWFPKGKSATLQIIEKHLDAYAREMLHAVDQPWD